MLSREFLSTIFVQFRQTRFWLPKLAMVGLAMGMMVMVFFYTGVKNLIGSLLTPKINITNISQNGVAIDNGVIHLQFLNGDGFVITSRHITNQDNSNNLLLFTDLSGQWLKTNSSNAPATLIDFSAPKGVLSKSDNTITLTDQGHIVIHNNTGGVGVDGGNMVVDFKQRLIFSQNPVHGKAIAGRAVGVQEFLGAGFGVEKNGQVMKLLGPSLVVIGQGE